MAIELPKTKVKSNLQDPKYLIIFGKPKIGKSTALAALPNNLIIDLESGYKYIDAMKVEAKSVSDLKEIAMKLTEMHEQTYMWDASDKIAPILDGIVQTHVRNAELTGGKVTPRTFIRSFISVLDTVQQNQQAFKTSEDILEMFNQEESGNDIDFDDIDEFDDDW